MVEELSENVILGRDVEEAFNKLMMKAIRQGEQAEQAIQTTTSAEVKVTREQRKKEQVEDKQVEAIKKSEEVLVKDPQKVLEGSKMENSEEKTQEENIEELFIDDIDVNVLTEARDEENLQTVAGLGDSCGQRDRQW